MIDIKNFTPRKYQEEIVKTATEKNTLAVLPTGTGKTKIAILLAINRLNKFPDSKILIITPTRPLSAQIQAEFQDNLTLEKEKIILLTGTIKPEIRKEIYKNSIVVVATPQTIEKDIENSRLSLENFSLLVIDEAHRSRQRFANTIVAKSYSEQSKFPRILALTASPGSTKDKINEIKDNLFIESVEIRTDQDIQEFIQQKNIEWINVILPDSLKELHSIIKNYYKTRLLDLKNIGFTKPTSIISKKDLLLLQVNLRKNLTNHPTNFYGLSLTAQLIKVDYALELLETQSLLSLSNFWNKLKQEQTKAAKTILKSKEIIKAIELTNFLISKNIKHPKLETLKSLIEDGLNKNKDSKIIVFASFRDTVNEIYNLLKDSDSIKPVKLIGQKLGLKQSEQLQVIKDYENKIYNTIISTQIGEEGIHLASADLAIFYDQSASSIRRIQRLGRVGRIKSGKIIFIITKDTRDEGFYWKSKRDEKRMHYILQNMQQKLK